MTNTIVISGGSRGIGFAIAEVFATQGWTVFTAARSASDLEQMQDIWKTKFPKNKLLTKIADLSTQEGCTSFASNVRMHTNKLQILVNNVGQFASGTLLDATANQLDYFIKTNVLSAHYLTRELRPLLSNTLDSHLFTIGSVAANIPPPEMATYALSKTFLHHWHREISKELALQAIRSTLIIPGATYTSSWDGIDIDPKQLLSADEVADLLWTNWKNKGVPNELIIEKR